MRGCINQGARERRCQQVSKGVSFLKQSRHDPTGLRGAVLEGGRSGVTE